MSKDTPRTGPGAGRPSLLIALACASTLIAHRALLRPREDSAAPRDAEAERAVKRRVALRATGARALLAETLAEVRTRDGALLHRGVLEAALELELPPGVDDLVVSLWSSWGARTVTVPVAGAEILLTVDART